MFADAGENAPSALVPAMLLKVGPVSTGDTLLMVTLPVLVTV
jgi:hypothetical protein